MTVVFKDIRNRLNTPKQLVPINGIKFAEILYADDTMIIMKETEQANDLLRRIEQESRYYNMKLNRDKCVVIAMNTKHSIRFEDGTELKGVKEEKYLGSIYYFALIKAFYDFNRTYVFDY